ncbi:DMT family transporter [Pseudorhodobacter sp.]|uniref:DMT family transporter n=1 Tax=Pseudorhodobacter sp. TaxID=1934400 RepID=UPI002647C470|nr:DMT family transporter [Pseudorhodobacter sp.]MDN5787302.1 DMT family transporter [Pseudorhodobacter sp.]
MQSPTRRDWFSILFLGVLWGGTFMVVSIALRGYGPTTVATARVTLGAFALVLLCLALGRRPLPRWDAVLWRYLLPIGVLSSALPFFLLAWAQSFVPSAFAGLSMAAVPLFVLPLAYVFAGEAINRMKVIGFGLGFLGTLVLLGPEVVEGGPLVLPRLACIGAALCYAFASILTRRCPPIDPITLATTSLIIGAIPLLPLMFVTEGRPHYAGSVPGIAIIGLGLLPTALAAFLRVSVIRSAGSSFMTLTSYQVPLWSMFFGGVILSEVIPHRFYLALGLILAGLFLSQRRPKP